MPAQATQLMGSKGYGHSYNGQWVFVDENSPYAWKTSALNFMPRLGAAYRLDDKSVARVGYARFLMPITNVRDTLGDFVNQYTGFAQTTTTLGLANGVPQQRLNDPYPANNPVIEPYGQAYGRYTGLGGAVSLDQYNLRPQVNDRFNFSYQRELWAKTIVEASYFLNLGTRVPYDVNLNMMDPAFRYEQKAALNTQVTNPFFNYLTPDKFPGALRNNRTVTLGSLLVPYPQYGTITQTNTNGKKLNTQTLELRGQRPFSNGFSVLVAYAYNRERVQQWFDDIANYEVLTSGGEEGWEWRPTDTPVHRLTVGVDVADSRGSWPRLRLRLECRGRCRARRLAVHRVGPLLFGPPGVLQHQLRRVGQPEAGLADPRSLVRYQHVRGAGFVHAAEQPVHL